MDRIEAMKLLSEIKRYLTAGNPVWDVDEIAEACDMGIKALSEEPKTKCIAQIRIDRDDIEDLVDEKVNEIVDKMAEPKHGKWVHHDGGYSDHYECPACGTSIVLTGRWKFCPNCGARMRSEEE